MSPRAEGRRVQKMTNPTVSNNSDTSVKPHSGEFTPSIDPGADSYEAGFYNPHDGLKGRDGGPYLDHVLRQQAELNRAAVEGRDPLPLNGVLPPDAGTPLVPASQVVDNSWTSNPSMRQYPAFDAVLTDKDIKNHGKDNWAVTSPVVVVEVDLRTEAPEDAHDATRNDAPTQASLTSPTVSTEDGSTVASPNYVGESNL